MKNNNPIARRSGSPHNTRRSGSLSVAAFHSQQSQQQQQPQSSQPSIQSQRLKARRNSEAPSSSSSTALPKGALKRKVSSTSTSPKAIDSVCPSCAHCADCDRHWRSLAQDSGVAGTAQPHDPEHGHIHARAWADLTVPPQHPPPHNHHFAQHNHHGALPLKPNHAIRTAESLSDSPQHTSLALSPALRSRKLHHSMLHGRSYEVSSVLDARVRHGVVEYLVSWSGYPDFFNCWLEASGVMEACAELVGEFEEQQREQEGRSRTEDEEENSAASPYSEGQRARALHAEGHPQQHYQQHQQREGASSPPLPHLHPPLHHSLRDLPGMSDASDMLLRETGGDEDDDDAELIAVHQQATSDDAAYKHIPTPHTHMHQQQQQHHHAHDRAPAS